MSYEELSNCHKCPLRTVSNCPLFTQVNFIPYLQVIFDKPTREDNAVLMPFYDRPSQLIRKLVYEIFPIYSICFHYSVKCHNDTFSLKEGLTCVETWLKPEIEKSPESSLLIMGTQSFYWAKKSEITAMKGGFQENLGYNEQYKTALYYSPTYVLSHGKKSVNALKDILKRIKGD